MKRITEADIRRAEARHRTAPDPVRPTYVTMRQRHEEAAAAMLPDGFPDIEPDPDTLPADLDAWAAGTAAAATDQDLAEAVRARQVHGIARNLSESQPD